MMDEEDDGAHMSFEMVMVAMSMMVMVNDKLWWTAWRREKNKDNISINKNIGSTITMRRDGDEDNVNVDCDGEDDFVTFPINSSFIQLTFKAY